MINDQSADIGEEGGLHANKVIIVTDIIFRCVDQSKMMNSQLIILLSNSQFFLILLVVFYLLRVAFSKLFNQPLKSHRSRV